MTIYVVTAVHWNERDEIDRVRWAEVVGADNRFAEALHEVPVDRVVEAFDRADVVELVIEAPEGRLSGGRLRRKVLADGVETIREEQPREGRTLRDLPTF